MPTFAVTALLFAHIANPVWKGNYADPTVWDGGDGWYYAYATPSRENIDILRSRDLFAWEPSGKKAFLDGTLKVVNRDWDYVWAPDVFKLDDRHWLLYVALYKKRCNSAIAVFRADSPTGPFTDGRVITDEKSNGIHDSIDPEVVRDPDDQNRLWLYFGSSGGIHRLQLTRDGLAQRVGTKIEFVAGLTTRQDPTRAQVFEAPYLYARNGWWYLFVSTGGFDVVDGPGRYRLAVGRARKLSGPFLDREGRDMRQGHATILLDSKADDRFWGPGHNGEIFTRDGRDYIFYHCHDRTLSGDPRKPGYKARHLFVRELSWDADGWPLLRSQTSETLVE